MPADAIRPTVHGTGTQFSEQLAARGMNLLPIARRVGPLAALAARLAKSANVEVKTLPLDLSSPWAADNILAAPYEVGLHASNAGADHSAAHFTDYPI
jgi:short-subunit dehydrogenase